MDPYTSSMISLAIGDCFGLPYEFKHSEDISDIPTVPYHLEISDDTELSMITLYTFIKYEKSDWEIQIKKDYQEWIHTTKCGTGFSLDSALKDGIIKPNSQSNGSLMRIIPLVSYLKYKNYSMSETNDIIEKITSITHSNLKTHEVNNLIINIIYNDEKIDEKFLPLVEEIVNVENKFGWVLSTCKVVFEAMNEPTLIQGLQYICYQGEDSDTNCAIYCAIYGEKNDISKEDIDLDKYLPSDILNEIIKNKETLELKKVS